jgi:superfamily II DNA or RNA helicase
MSRQELSPGDVVEGLEPDEHVEIRRVVPFGSRFLVEGVGVRSRREIKRPLAEEELARLRVVRGSGYTYDGDAEAFLLGVEAERIRIAYRFDPLFAVNSSVVDEVPHQVEAVYRYLLPLPRIRYLLADDTGAGKTIMAGLLLKELLLRGVVQKVLIITPGGLTGQWRDELEEKFGLEFRLVNRASFEADPGQFARTDSGFFLTSIDFLARNEGCLNAARETQWDLIIVDEAHKLSAFEYGTKLERTERYKAVEALASRTDHLLFLTATPHRGRPDTFRRLLMLLDLDLFQRDDHVTRHIRGEGRERFFLRRLKEEMVDWEGRPLFKPRYTRTVGYELTPEELELYEAVTDYVRRYRKEAKARRNRNVELTLMIMQRRLASSLYAITRTLERRVAAIEETLRILRDPTRSAAEKRRLARGDAGDEVPTHIAGYEELDERQRQAVEERVFRQVLSDDPETVERELREVKELLRLAQSLREHKEAKFEELLKVLDASEVIRSEDEKLLIFTEHKDTLDSLTHRLEAQGYSVVTIHGGMDIEARKRAQIEFHKRAKIMVATDAAGEGINLQFCRYLINWDIPWNPNRLEQRMGRIHRYGQRGDVWVFNLVALNTREGKVLEKVLSKLDVMRQQLGDDRVYDVIDELLEEVPLVELIERSIDAENPQDVEQEAQRLLGDPHFEARACELVELQRERALVARPNLGAARELRDRSDEHRLHPLFIRNFFLRAYRAAGGTVEADPYYPVYRVVGRVPEALLQVARRRRINLAERYDETPFVFDKALLSVTSEISVPEGTRLLGPAHPLFEAVCEWVLERAQEAFTRGATLIDPNAQEPQRVWLIRSRVRDTQREGRRRVAHEEFVAVVEDESGLRSISPAYLLNCTAPEDSAVRPELPDQPVEELQRWVYEHLTELQLERVREEREAEVARRREYLETTFTDLILDLQEKLNELYRAQMYGEDNPEERQRLEERLQELKERKARRLEELERMRQLSADLPEVVTSAVIVPAPVAVVEGEDEAITIRQGIPMRRDDEVERIAMEVAMRYERSRGWTPEDVSQEGLHYDIRSVGPNGEKRFIEVKGRAHTGPIVLTAPEADKLRQLGERAFLYIVTFCKGEKPRLRIIQNPMAYLTPEVLYRQVQFLVEEEQWAKFGEEVEVA